MNLIWRAQQWHHDGTGGYHLSEDGARQALCGGNVLNAEVEPRPDRDACCTRCEILAEIAGYKVPPAFRMRKGEAPGGQGPLL